MKALTCLCGQPARFHCHECSRDLCHRHVVLSSPGGNKEVCYPDCEARFWKQLQDAHGRVLAVA